MVRRLAGKVALVTGAARGIGAATAKRFGDEGARVVLADVLEEEGRKLAQDLRSRDVGAQFVKLDVSDPSEWSDAVAGAVHEFGALHVLVNNAGIARLEDVESETVEGWSRLIAVNQTGVWLGMRAAAPAIRGAGGGSIVNVSSIYGAVGGNGAAVAYHASKGAVRLMTKSAAIRFASDGIRVNSIHPGFIATPMLDPILSVSDPAARELAKFILDRTPMQRLGKAEEVAAAIAFLASDDASYVTGSELYVDGGWTAW